LKSQFHLLPVLKIGLTGGIGSGKSMVARIFRELGIPVYDADAAAKRLMQEDALLRTAIQQHFGTAVYENGQLNRKVLAAAVFGNKEKLELLNSLVHPATIADAKTWFEQQTAAYVVKEAALLFETGSVEGLDYVIGVTAPVALRIKRVMTRDGVTAAEVQQRMRNQLDDTIKMRLCDYVLRNDDRHLLLPQVLELHEQLLTSATQTTPAL
jgi:dephospho-CoA kinase